MCMNNFVLEPYNYYVLYASLILLILFLIYTVVRAAHLLKTVSSMKTSLKPVHDNVTLAKIKMEAMQEKKAEDSKKNKAASVLIPFLLLAYRLYKEDDELHGWKGYRKAAGRAMRLEKEEKRILSKLKTDL